MVEVLNVDMILSGRAVGPKFLVRLWTVGVIVEETVEAWVFEEVEVVGENEKDEVVVAAMFVVVLSSYEPGSLG